MMAASQFSGEGAPMNIRTMHLAVLLLSTAGLSSCDAPEQPQFQKVTYVDDVEPIIQKHCVVCHVTGQQGARESGLLMDSYESLMKGTTFGQVINPGSAMSSSLYILVSGKDRLTVTMPHGKKPLSDEEIETIRVWIENGAVEN
jgi:mono/diheme cytochrome c family protein